MFRVYSGYVQSIFRVCLGYVQGMFRVCSEYVQYWSHFIRSLSFKSIFGIVTFFPQTSKVLGMSSSKTNKKIVFWSLLGQDFICMWEQLQCCQSSYSCFCKNILCFGQLTGKYYFSAWPYMHFHTITNQKIVYGHSLTGTRLPKNID